MTASPPAPPYGTGTIADVLPAAAALLGVDGLPDALSLGGDLPDAVAPQAVTVLLIDGLGWWPWLGQVDRTLTLQAMGRRPLMTTVPSTTPTALVSLGTGLPPGGHGIVGATFRIPEDDLVLHPLSWTTDPHPVATQPEPTVFERAVAAGIPVVRVGASAYATSGLTRAGLRGGEYVAADSRGEVIDAIAGHRRGLAYAYVPDLDRLGHVHGVDSPQWRRCLSEIDDLVAGILDRIGPDHRLIVTADHGMVDCPDSGRIRMDDLPLAADVALVAGEPRLRHVYCRPGTSARVVAAWREFLGERAWVLGRDEVLESGLMGTIDPDYADRVGDVVVLAQGTTVLTSEADALVSALRGQHGSVTEAEMAIPLLQAVGVAAGGTRG